MQKKEKGLALSLEVVLIVGFIVLMGTMGVYSWSNMNNDKKIQSARAELSQLSTAVNQYHYEMKKYPEKLEDLTTQSSDKNYGPWIHQLKKDPWGHDYKIQSDDDTFIVYSLGKDGAEGVSLSSLTKDTSSTKGQTGDDIYLFGN